MTASSGSLLRDSSDPVRGHAGFWFALRPIALIVSACLLQGCSWFPNGPVLCASPTEVLDAPAGEPCLILLSCSMPGEWPSTPLPLTLSATHAAEVVAPDMMELDSLTEVLVTPPNEAIGDQVVLRFSTAYRNFATVTLRVTESPQAPTELRRDAETILESFIPWLHETVPEIDFDDMAHWAGIPIRLHRLVVSHYMFLSTDWEVVVWWHVTTPPHDWARIYVRRRYVDVQPRLAAEISSVLGGEESASIAPPNEIVR